jgi:hypothetical protein
MEARSSLPLSRASVIGNDGKLVANIYNSEESEALRIARQFAASGDLLEACQRLIDGGDPVLVYSLARAAIDRCGDTSPSEQADPKVMNSCIVQSGLTKSERTILEALRNTEAIKTSRLVEVTGLRGNAFFRAWGNLRSKGFARALVPKTGSEYTITDTGRAALDEAEEEAAESDRIRGLID